MKTFNILLIMLVAVSIASCTKKKSTDNPQHQIETSRHQIETISELIDSAANRGITATLYIGCREDSVFETYRLFAHACIDTTEYKDSVTAYKKFERSFTVKYNYLSQNIPELLDRLSKNAETSYRYQLGDSVDYSITIGNNPRELISMKTYKKGNRKYIELSHYVSKPIKKTVKSDGIKPFKKALNAFIKERKDVKKYEVKYKWDKGVAIPEKYDGSRYVIWDDADSLAASSVTGTHLFIPAVELESKINVALDFYNRLNRIVTETPQCKSQFMTTARFKTDLEKGVWYNPMLRYWVCNDKGKFLYLIIMGYTPEGIDILELNTANAPRFTVPRNWEKIKETHNLDVVYEWDLIDN